MKKPFLSILLILLFAAKTCAQPSCVMPSASPRSHGLCASPAWGFVPSPHFGYCPSPWWGSSWGYSAGPVWGYSGLPAPVIDYCQPVISGQVLPPENKAADRLIELSPYLSQPPSARPSDLSHPSTPGSLDKVLSGVWPGSEEPQTSLVQPGTEKGPRTENKYLSLIDDYTRALASNPNCAGYHLNRGLAYAWLKKYPKALLELEQAISLAPDNASSYYNRACIYQALGNWDLSQSDCTRALTLSPDSIRYLYKRALIRLKLGQTVAALADLTSALKLDPRSAQLYLTRGLAYFDSNQAERALNDYNQSLRLLPGNRQALFARAMLYFSIRQYRLATQSFDQLIALAPDSPDAFENRGLAYFQLGEYEKAIDDYGAAIALAPASWHCYLNRAVAHLFLLKGADCAADASQALSLAGWEQEAAPQLAALVCLGYIQAHNSAAEAAFLTESTAHLNPDKWPYPIFLFWQKKKSAEQLLSLAASGDAQTQARAWIGMTELWSGQPAAAVPYLKWVKENGASDLLEYSLAQTCLRGTPTKLKAVASHPVQNKWAVVVGVSKFKDTGINLKYADKDARDFYQYLTTAGGFAADHVKLLLNEQASREKILSEIGDSFLPRVSSPQDLVVVYFSTHGSPSMLDENGLNYLVAYDTDKFKLFATGLPVQDLTRLIKERIPAEKVLVILDACHSGAAEVDAKGLTRNTNFNCEQLAREGAELVLCSSEPSQLSWESKRYPNSVFTHQLIAGLKLKGHATRLGEAYSYAKNTVQQEVRLDRGQEQTPVLKSTWPGNDLALAVPPAESGSEATSAGTTKATSKAIPPEPGVSGASSPSPSARAGKSH